PPPPAPRASSTFSLLRKPCQRIRRSPVRGLASLALFPKQCNALECRSFALDAAGESRANAFAMANPNRVADYERRMHNVVEYIDRHLDRPLDLPALADVAHFSPFHFHRLFSAWMGERVGDYLRRRRVEIAAVRLSSQPRVAILDVALAVGF